MHGTLQTTASYILASEQLRRQGTPTLQLVNRPRQLQAAALLGQRHGAQSSRVPAWARPLPACMPVRSCSYIQVHARVTHAYACAPPCRVELGTIMLWYYVADRTEVFPRNTKGYSRDVLGFIFLALTLVAGWTSLKPCRTPMLLNRQQTEEWKGWMQASLAFLPTADCRCWSTSGEPSLSL